MLAGSFDFREDSGTRLPWARARAATATTLMRTSDDRRVHVCRHMPCKYFPDHRRRSGMESFRGQQLSVEVQLMNEPSLWRWDIRDGERDEVVDSSWTREWMAYE